MVTPRGRLDAAVDFGTKELRIAVGSAPLFRAPSLVAIDRRRQEVVAVGEEALRFQSLRGSGIEVVQPVRQGVVHDVEGSLLLLRQALKQVLGRFLRRPRLLLVVPAYATPSERHLLREVAEAAGAASPILLENTVAAALGLGVDLMAPRGHMVLDVGAGGFAAAVLCLGGTHVARTGRTGGDSIDEAIAEWVRQHFALAISRGSAERLKEAIGGVGPCRSPGRMEVHGQDTASGLPRAVEVDARDLAGVIEGVLRPVVAAAKDALAQASAELVADVAESGIWLTGGTACLAGLADWLAAETGVFVHLAEHPHETVVEGARRALSGEIREDHVVLRPRVV